MMARKRAVETIDDDEVAELEEVTEIEGGDDSPAESDMLTAKAAASKLGTDGRTLRKFLRSKHGLVGQGQRWAIDPNDIAQLKVEFEAWAGATKAKTKTKKSEPKADIVEELDPIEDAELEEFEEELEDLEPTAEELEVIEDLDDLEEIEELD